MLGGEIEIEIEIVPWSMKHLNFETKAQQKPNQNEDMSQVLLADLLSFEKIPSRKYKRRRIKKMSVIMGLPIPNT